MQPPADTRELGLVLWHGLFGLDELHFGLWPPGTEPAVADLSRAQARLSDTWIAQLPQAPARILDVGCGTGHIMQRLLQQGYEVEGVSPAISLNQQIRERLSGFAGRYRLHECAFEKLPAEIGPFDAVLFGESYQYVPMGPSFERLGALLADEGRVIIGDFFRKDAARDGGAGDGVLRGGHGLEKFYRLAATQPFRIVLDEDQTPAASGTLALFEQVASERVIPFLQATGAFLRKRYPLRGRLLSWLVRQPLRRAEQRYLGGHYNQATFEKYKSYRLIVLQKVVA